jgi:hypothetical protein
MGRPGSGGGGGASIFTSSIIGDGTFGASIYIDLGLIPSGQKTWFGAGQFASPDKTSTFELRTNIASQGSGSDANTLILGAINAGARSGTVTKDFYKNGSLHTVSALGSGVERIWLKIKSKTAASGSYYFLITHTVE